MRKKYFVIVLLHLLFSSSLKAQLHDAKWLLCNGKNNLYSNIFLEFDTINSSPTIQITNTYIPMLLENASICDVRGEFLFFTNGTRIFDKNFNFMAGGNLAPPLDTNGLAYGLAQRQGCMFLPWPNDTNKYLLLHTTKEFLLPMSYVGWIPSHVPIHLYATVLDKSLNAGSGGIVSINQSILFDTLCNSGGGLAVTKHANGRDWWIIVKKHYRNEYFKFLLSPSGIQLMGSQSIGLDYQVRLGEIYLFSPNGEILAGVIGAHNIALFNFDRCTGLLSNYQVLNNPNNANGGLEDLDFSSNSRYLYTPERLRIFQYDLLNINTPGAVQSTQVLVADTQFVFSVCDSANNFVTYYPFGQLALNGKIYYPTNFTCNEVSYFESPDSAGLLSDFQYGGLNIISYHAAAVPYFPNYRLGPVAGSPCDTLSVGVNELQASQVLLYPNPTKGNLNISLGKLCNDISLRLFSLQGQVLLTQKWDYGTALTLALPPLASGLYLVEIKCNEGVVIKKVLFNQH